MKTALITTLTLLLTLTAGAYAASGPLSGTYTIVYDKAVDGRIIPAATYKIVFNSHHDKITGHYAGIDNDSIFDGHIYSDRGHTIIEFTQYDATYHAVFAGKMTGANRFQGVWFNVAGDVGEFVLTRE